MKNILWANNMYINIDTCPPISLILNIFKMVQLKKISLKKIYVCTCNTSLSLYKFYPSMVVLGSNYFGQRFIAQGSNFKSGSEEKIHRDCSSPVWTSMKLSKHESASVHDTNSDRTRARHGLDGPAKRNHFSSGAGLYCSIFCVFSMVTRISSTRYQLMQVGKLGWPSLNANRDRI